LNRHNVIRSLLILTLCLMTVQSVGSLNKASLTRDLLLKDAIPKNYPIAFGSGGATTTKENAVADSYSQNNMILDLTLSKEYPSSIWPIEQQ